MIYLIFLSLSFFLSEKWTFHDLYALGIGKWTSNDLTHRLISAYVSHLINVL